MKKTIGVRLTEVAKASGLNLTTLAVRMGMVPRTLYHQAAQDRLMATTLARAALVLGHPVGVFFEDVEIPTKQAGLHIARTLPLLDSPIPGGRPTLGERQFTSRLPVTDREAETADYVIVVEGDSMCFFEHHTQHTLGYEPGVEIGIKSVSEGYVPPAGQVVLVAVRDDADHQWGLMLKQYVNRTEDAILLRNWNPLYTDLSIPIKQICIVGRYAWMRHIAKPHIGRPRRRV